MTRIEAARIEQAIINHTGMTEEVVSLMFRSGSLWHDLMHGIVNNVKDRKILDAIDKSSFILPDGEKAKNAKYDSLRKVANYFGLLADTFLAIERHIQKEAGK